MHNADISSPGDNRAQPARKQKTTNTSHVTCVRHIHGCERTIDNAALVTTLCEGNANDVLHQHMKEQAQTRKTRTAVSFSRTWTEVFGDLFYFHHAGNVKSLEDFANLYFFHDTRRSTDVKGPVIDIVPGFSLDP